MVNDAHLSKELSALKQASVGRNHHQISAPPVWMKKWRNCCCHILQQRIVGGTLGYLGVFNSI